MPVKLWKKIKLSYANFYYRGKNKNNILKIVVLTLRYRTWIMEKTFACKNCDKVFKSNASLVKHLKTHEPDTIESLKTRLEEYVRITKSLENRLNHLEYRLSREKYFVRRPTQIIFNDMNIDSIEDLPISVKNTIKPYFERYTGSIYSFSSSSSEEEC